MESSARRRPLDRTRRGCATDRARRGRTIDYICRRHSMDRVCGRRALESSSGRRAVDPTRRHIICPFCVRLPQCLLVHYNRPHLPQGPRNPVSRVSPARALLQTALCHCSKAKEKLRQPRNTQHLFCVSLRASAVVCRVPRDDPGAGCEFCNQNLPCPISQFLGIRSCTSDRPCSAAITFCAASMVRDMACARV